MNHTKLYLLILALISVLFLSTVSKGQEPIWDSSCTQIVYTNSIFNCGNYSISNTQFSAPVRGVKNIDGKIVTEYTVNPSIIFNISKDNVENETVVLTISDNVYIDPDKFVKVNVSEFTDGNSLLWTFEQYNPRVQITYYFCQRPSIDLYLQTDKSLYMIGKDNYVNFNVTVKNIGSVTANNIDVIISSTLNTNNKLTFHINTLGKNNSQIFSINFDIPNFGVESLNTISVNSKIDDEQNIGKFLYFMKNISMNFIEKPQVQQIYITKYIKDRVYASDNITVFITVSNIGDSDIYSIYIDDNLGNILVPYSNLHWEYPNIKSKGQIEIRYQAVVNKIGNYTIPAASVKFDIRGQPQTNYSNTVEINTIDVPTKYKKVILTPNLTPESTPIVTKAVDIIEPNVVETVISTPIRETEIIPIIPPTTTPKIPGFEGIFAILIIFITRIMNRNL